MFVLSLSGCGYKASPYYIQEAPKGDDNVNFTIIKQEDNNTTIDKSECK